MPALVPVVLERTFQGERSYDLFSRLLKDRIIFLHDAINDQIASLFIGQLLYLEAEDPKSDIYVYINSPGGSVSSAMAMYDTMQYVKPDIVTIGMGLAASAGSLILQSGAAGKRFALPNTSIMIHSVQIQGGGISGSMPDIETYTEHLRETDKRLTDIYVRHSGNEKRDHKFYKEKMLRDTFITAEDALSEFGLIDKIIDKNEIAVPRSDQ
jgi:ATP-dependent Clp protease protease subunit